jgi:uncharacterized protein (DUF433 family)
VVRGTAIHVQSLVTAAKEWGLSKEQLADEYDLSKAQVEDALAFYREHQAEIDALLAADQALEPAHAQA